MNKNNINSNATRLETLCVRINRYCNLSCNFCRAGSSPLTHGQLNIDKFKTFVLDAQTNLHLKHVSISGGEPGLDKRLSGLVEFLIENGFKVSITTNGTTNLNRRIDSIISNAIDKIRIRVSVDGDSILHDNIRGQLTYRKAIEEIHEFKQKGAWVGINTVVLPETTNCCEGLAKEAEKFGIDQWALITPVPEGSALGRSWINQIANARIQRLQDNIRIYGYTGQIKIWDFIGSPNTSVLIRTNGDIILAGVRGYDDCIIGSLYDYDFNIIKHAIRTVESIRKSCHFSWSNSNSSHI